jgi:uncharacterized protein (TIGR02646 family)
MRLTQPSVAPRLVSLLESIEPSRKWDSSGNQETHDQIKARLLSLQDRVCAFCERPITNEQSSVEHLHPKQSTGCSHRPTNHPHYDWTNLVLTCNTNSTCNGAKADLHLCAELETLGIHQNWIRVDPLSGSVSAAKTLGVAAASAAKSLIAALNLNDPDLRTRRRNLRKAAVSKLIDEGLSEQQVKFELATEGFYTTVDLVCASLA